MCVRRLVFSTALVAVKVETLITFVEKINHLTFAEAVEQLAAQTGVSLRYEEGSAPTNAIEPGTRQRLVAANRAAEAFYRSQLTSPASGRRPPIFRSACL